MEVILVSIHMTLINNEIEILENIDLSTSFDLQEDKHKTPWNTNWTSNKTSVVNWEALLEKSLS